MPHPRPCGRTNLYDLGHGACRPALLRVNERPELAVYWVLQHLFSKNGVIGLRNQHFPKGLHGFGRLQRPEQLPIL